MPRIRCEIVIVRPVTEVFDVVADERNEPNYNPQMLSVESLTPGPVGAGYRFAAARLDRRRPVAMQVELTEYARPRRPASTTTMARGLVRGVLTFEPVGSATRMRWDWDVPLAGFARLAAPVVKAVGARQERACWRGLEEQVEAGRPQRMEEGPR